MQAFAISIKFKSNNHIKTVHLVFKSHLNEQVSLKYLACCCYTGIDCYINTFNYCQISNIGRTKSHNLNVSRLALLLRNLLKPGVKWIMNM